MQEYIEKAKILIEALPYIKHFNGITVVIKYGGSALINEEIKSTIIKDIALMKFVGFKPVIVHGGGPDINNMLGRVGIKSEFVNGLRRTTAETMEIVEMVLAGKINKAIATQLTLEGVSAVGLSGKDGGLLKVEPMRPNGEDIGFVGQVTEVNTGIVKTLLDNDYIPIISPIGFDSDGNSYNINADYAAVSIAGALSAEKLVFLTDVSGVLRDVADPASIIPFMKVAEADEMIATGVISGGMIPKVQCCISGVEAGVRDVHILDGRVEHSLILEIFTTKGIGTLIEA